MRYGFVLSEWHRDGGRYGWESTRKTVEVSGSSVAELKKRLRPWALDVVGGERFDDGWYLAYLVELDEDGEFDTYLALEVEDVLWFYEREYVPAADA